MIHFTLDEPDRQIVLLALATLTQSRPGLSSAAEAIASYLQGDEWYRCYCNNDPETMPSHFGYRNPKPLLPEFRVVNLADPGLTYLPEDVVYVGRRFSKWKAHPLANPFRIATDDRDTRIACVQAYRHWLMTRPNLGRELERLWQATRNGALPLACWCVPKACHATILADALSAYVREKHGSERKTIPFEMAATEMSAPASGGR